jgi:hypothetical protein
MILNQLKTNNNEEYYKIFSKLLFARLNVFLSNTEYSRFLYCMNKIAIHHVVYIDNFLPNKIIEFLPNIYGELKSITLRLILWRCEFIEEFFTSFQPYLKNLLQHKDDITQVITLQILMKLLKILNNKEINHILNIILNINTSKEVFHSIFSESCRDVYYDILIWL